MLLMKKSQETKTLHPRNAHNQRYDFEALIKTMPELKEFVAMNKYNDLSIDFSNAKAVLCLNKALLSHFYKIKNWEIPEDYLCPPIPGRADYVHYLADLLAQDNKNKIPTKNIIGLDIGTGANSIYPLLGASIYDWDFVATDVDPIAISSVENIVNSNDALKGKIKAVFQNNKGLIFNGVLNKEDNYDFSMCNPPFYKSRKDALDTNKKKVSNLSKGKKTESSLNFGGATNELWYKGGELAFILKMIKESVYYKRNCCWFTTLVSKGENLNTIFDALDNENAIYEAIDMKQGNKITRFVAWSFLSDNERQAWFANKS